MAMIFESPPHIRMDCYNSSGNVASKTPLAMSQWIHVVHTFKEGESKLYVNGVLDGENNGGLPLNVRTPARMYIGGWYGNYQFVGDIDEVRVAKVTRSADWVRMTYENQKPMQPLVGPLVLPGADFAASAKEITVSEGKSATATAKAGDAQKIYWILKKGGVESIAAVDKPGFTIDAGRVSGDQPMTLIFKAVYPNSVKNLEIPVTVKEEIPDPVFTLKAPATWDGRSILEVVPQISNLKDMQAKNVGGLKYDWKVSGLAVIKEMQPGKLIPRRAQNSGTMTVTASIGNGGNHLIDGQSNALATDTAEKAPAGTSDWIRSYGGPAGDSKGDPQNLWCNPVWKIENGEKAQLGWWGMDLARRLVERQKIPLFIVNGAGGGTRIDQHQRNEANPDDLNTIYGRMLLRVKQARLPHGIRGILCHQGESYTQLTDVEQERNGLYFYDTRKPKFDVARLHAITSRQAAYERDNPMITKSTAPLPKPVWKVLVGAVQDGDRSAPYAYATEQPAANWSEESFDDRAWKTGRAPCGHGPQNVRTDWTTPDICLRKKFEYDGTTLKHGAVVISYDEDTEIYVNGKKILSLCGYITNYQLTSVTDALKKALKNGSNTLAVHTHQAVGGQYSDLARLVEN
ncbi:MAG: hypothetical protein K9N23_12710 [Akkermansiaceae bacterium]|nr:hypothetical protein [Akkermansiaceae bacterium]